MTFHIYSALILYLSACAAAVPTTLARDDRAAQAWAEAPDFSTDSDPPYPPIKNEDGSNITIENLRGARLFGWDGCNTDQKKNIPDAWADFHSLVSQDGIKDNIDWKGQAAQEFFGAAEGKPFPREVQAHIQHIYQAAEAMWIHWWTDWLKIPDEPFAWKWL